jgi:hypothetical protein
MGRLPYVSGVEIGVVWGVVGPQEKRWRRAGVRVRYSSKEIGYAESRLLDLDASSEECFRAANEAVLAAIMDALDFLMIVAEHNARIAADVMRLRRSFDGPTG